MDEPEKGKFYFLRRPLEDIEEDVVTGGELSSDRKKYTRTSGILCYRGKSEDSLEFLQAIELPVKKEGKIIREIKSIILYQTPETNYNYTEGNVMHLKDRHGSSREYKKTNSKFEELKEEYLDAIQKEGVEDTSHLIKKLKSEA